MSYQIKAGDLTPPLELFLTDAHGGPVDLSLYTPRVVIASRPGATPIVDGPGQVVDAQAGRLLYLWLEGETDVPGHYRVEVILEDENGDELTIPGAGYGIITISRRLA